MSLKFVSFLNLYQKGGIIPYDQLDLKSVINISKSKVCSSQFLTTQWSIYGFIDKTNP